MGRAGTSLHLSVATTGTTHGAGQNLLNTNLLAIVGLQSHSRQPRASPQSRTTRRGCRLLSDSLLLLHQATSPVPNQTTPEYHLAQPIAQLAQSTLRYAGAIHHCRGGQILQLGYPTCVAAKYTNLDDRPPCFQCGFAPTQEPNALVLFALRQFSAGLAYPC